LEPTFRPHHVPSVHVRNIALDIILCLITCYIYNIYWQYRQMQALNAMLKTEKYSFVTWLLLTIVTCGLYHIYHEYRKSADLDKVLGRESMEPLAVLLLAIFGLGLIGDAIQQSSINSYFGNDDL
jgi:uncharacterized membrane protein YGL010W